MRLIDADACPALFDEEFKETRQLILQGETHLDNLAEGFTEADRVIRKMPTISPESLRPKGLWIGEGDGYADGELVYDVWYCSECNHCIDDGTDVPEMLPNYCPSCGAKMEG